MDKGICPLCQKKINVPTNTDGTYHDFHCTNCGEILRSRVKRVVTVEHSITKQSGSVGGELICPVLFKEWIDSWDKKPFLCPVIRR